MKCQKCEKDFLEKDIDESHDVPAYLFYSFIGRKEKKKEADKFGRHHLCKECHQKYEISLNKSLITTSIIFAEKYFKEEEDGDDTNTT